MHLKRRDALLGALGLMALPAARSAQDGSVWPRDLHVPGA